MTQLRLNHAVIFASTLLFAQAASADFIRPVGVIASGQSTYAESLIDDSGMRVKGNRDDHRNWSLLPGRDERIFDTIWIGRTGTPGPWVVIDLGSVCELETISVWGLNADADSMKAALERSVNKLNVYVRNDVCPNNLHENMAAFNPEGWRLVKRDLKVRNHSGGVAVNSPSGLVAAKDLAGVKGRYLALHAKGVAGGQLRNGSLAEVQVFGKSTTGFVHVRDDVPKGYLVPVNHEDGIPVSDLEEADCDRDALLALIHRIETSTENRIDSLLIAKDGKLVLERYFRRASVDQLHPVRSIIKKLLALCYGKAIDMGAIKSVNDPILNYLPEVDKGKLVDGIDSLTIKDFLTFRSGLCFADDYGARTKKQRFKEDTHAAWILEQATSVAEDRPFEYRSHHAEILNHVLYNATGKTLEEFAVEHFFRPMGIKQHRMRPHKCGLTYVWDNLSLRPRDVLKLGLLISNKGVWNGQRIVSADFIHEAVHRHFDRSIGLGGTDRQRYLEDRKSPQLDLPKGWSAGMGYTFTNLTFVIDGNSIEVVSAGGALGQQLLVLPDHNLVVVFTAGGIDQKTGTSRTTLFLIMQHDILPAFIKTAKQQ